MAMLEGSFPVKFNDRVIGTAHITDQNETGITFDVEFDHPELLDSITELVQLDQLPDMFFAFIADLPEPKGLMQIMKPAPVDWDKLRDALDGLTREEKDQAIRNYVQARYMRFDKD
jgi:hypothetical protein